MMQKSSSALPFNKKEGDTGFEPVTYRTAANCSTPELITQWHTLLPRLVPLIRSDLLPENFIGIGEKFLVKAWLGDFAVKSNRKIVFSDDSTISKT